MNLPNSENLPVIITGDFNLTPDQAPIKKYNFILQMFKNLPESDPQYGTSNGFDTEKIRKKRIDYIFIKGLKSKTAKHLYKKTPMGGWASDHHPVIVLLEK